MDAIKEALQLLQAQRDAIDKAMQALKFSGKSEDYKLESNLPAQLPQTTAKKRVVSAASRRKISQSMKKKWAERKA